MDAFASVIDALFADPNIGEDALWKASGSGAGVAVRIVFRTPDQAAGFGGGRFVATGRFVDVRVSEVASLQPGDTFEIEATPRTTRAAETASSRIHVPLNSGFMEFLMRRGMFFARAGCTVGG